MSREQNRIKMEWKKTERKRNRTKTVRECRSERTLAPSNHRSTIVGLNFLLTSTVGKVAARVSCVQRSCNGDTALVSCSFTLRFRNGPELLQMWNYRWTVVNHFTIVKDVYSCRGQPAAVILCHSPTALSQPSLSLNHVHILQRLMAPN